MKHSRKRAHKRPVYMKTEPYYLIRMEWVTTSGLKSCPSEYYNGLMASVHSALAAMQSDNMQDVLDWMKTARRQLNQAIRQAGKPGAEVPEIGRVYDFV